MSEFPLILILNFFLFGFYVSFGFLASLSSPFSPFRILSMPLEVEGWRAGRVAPQSAALVYVDAPNRADRNYRLRSQVNRVFPFTSLAAKPPKITFITNRIFFLPCASLLFIMHISMCNLELFWDFRTFLGAQVARNNSHIPIMKFHRPFFTFCLSFIPVSSRFGFVAVCCRKLKIDY